MITNADLREYKDVELIFDTNHRIILNFDFTVIDRPYAEHEGDLDPTLPTKMLQYESVNCFNWTVDGIQEAILREYDWEDSRKDFPVHGRPEGTKEQVEAYAKTIAEKAVKLIVESGRSLDD